MKTTYQESARLLNKSLVSIKNAVKNGVLVPLPRTALERYLDSRQVELFKGKDLSLNSLNENERKQWEAITAEIENLYEQELARKRRTPAAAATSTPVPAVPPVPASITFNVTPPEGTALDFMYKTDSALLVNTPAGPVSFRSAQVDKADKDEQVPEVTPGVAFLVLLGLIALIVFKPAMERQAETNKRIEQIIRRIRLEKEDLATSQRKIIAAMQGEEPLSALADDKALKTLESHPQETKELAELVTA